ncbi:6-carboxytetrahydropterin synthase QueD [Thermospira aquatica]|uniref:6-carboxy-5,6,7,8-tetrahydropterin synthase n=1 Tax=Thermospira aquatica TaxID=2828656 RepID=A0AAX3BBK3_9SPIR|nr:6-carboxytetrahydropterin synthase QueD [Thermospira aquatica]URA09692.1 6-carboxytetrahydropterin synthase QueD [Thermospira aquatica]
MIYRLIKEFTFDAAHNLINYNGKCEHLHGHTYKLQVTVEGPKDETTGMVCDFAELKQIVHEYIIQKLDHAYLNDIVPLSTAENLATWIANTLEFPLAQKNLRLVRLVLWETPGSAVELLL